MSRFTTLICLLAALSIVAGCDRDGFDPIEEEPTEPLYQGGAPRQEPPANVVGGFVAQLPEVTLQPGEEAFPCFVIPIELMGNSKIVGGAKLTAQFGLHHGNVTSRPKTPGEGIRECEEMDLAQGNEAIDIIQGGAWLFASSTAIEGDEWQTFADGQGFRVQEGHEIVAHMHYLNSSAAPVKVAPRYEWFTIDESTVEHVLAPFGFIYGGFTIPPLSTTTVTGNCEFPRKFKIVHLLPHMHKLGSSLTAEFMGGERDGELFLDSQGYDPDGGVIQQYDPPVDLSISDGVRFSCTWENTFNKTIEEGVGDNEMCMIFGYAYPEDSVYFGFAYDPEGDCLTVAVPSPGD